MNTFHTVEKCLAQRKKIDVLVGKNVFVRSALIKLHLL